ncbi:MFS transporter [Halorubrum luteum]
MAGETLVIEKTETSVYGITSDLLEDGKGWILLAVSIGWFFSIGVRFAYPTLLPFFQDAFSISLSMASLLVSILWVAYAVGQFPGGVLGDRFGEGNILVVSTLLSVVGIALVTISNTVYLLFVGTIAFGLATALYGPTRFTIFTDIYPDRSGTAVGFTMAVGSVGNTLLPVVAATIASYTSWRLGFGALIPIFIFLSITLWLLVPRRTSTPINNTPSLELIRDIFVSVCREGIPVLVSAHVIAAFVSQGFLALYPTYLVEIKGLSPSVGAILYGLYFAFGIVVQPLVGTVRDQFGPRRTLVALLGIYCASLLLLPFIHGAILIGILTIFLSSRSGAGVITNTFISTTLPEELKGSGLGLLRTVWLLIGATSPAIVGFFADMGYFEEAFFLLALLAGIATIFSLFVPDRCV